MRISVREGCSKKKAYVQMEEKKKKDESSVERRVEWETKVVQARAIVAV